MMKQITTVMTTAMIFLAGGGVASAQILYPQGLSPLKTSKMKNKMLLLICIFLFPFISQAQYTIAPDRTATQLMDQLLIGDGMSVHNVVLDCPGEQNAEYTIEDVPFLDSGIVFSVANAATIFSGLGVGGGMSVTDTIGWTESGDADLNAIYRSWGVDTYLLSFRTCKLTFDMVPHTDTVMMDFVFYDTRMFDSTFALQDLRLRPGCRPAVDIIGMLVSGGSEGYHKKNFAVFPDTDVPVNLYTLMKSTTNAAEFYSNCRDSTLWEDAPYDEYYFYIADSVTDSDDYFKPKAISRKISAVIPVTPCDTYSVKLAIGKNLFFLTGAEWGIEPPDAIYPTFAISGSAVFWSNLRGVGTPVVCAGDSSSSVAVVDIAAHTLQPYPNPASTLLYLDVGDIAASGTVYIVDPLGRICYQSSVDKKQIQLQIPIASLSAGLYQVLLSTDKGQYVGKFVKE